MAAATHGRKKHFPLLFSRERRGIVQELQLSETTKKTYGALSVGASMFAADYTLPAASVYFTPQFVYFARD
jgi:hypothetical protein